MRARSLALTFALACAGLFSACTDLPLGNGELACSLDHQCPPGYHCASDVLCWKDGSNPDFAGNPDLASTDGDVPDLLIPDQAMPDLLMTDLAMPDLAMPPDLALPDDAAADLSLPPDLSLADSASFDGPPRDLSMPDLSMPDLAKSDLSMPDLSMPDLARFDLSMPDLTLPDMARGDGGASFGASVIWSSGCGGTAVAPSTNRLDTGTFGTLSAGTVTAASGNQLSTGYLPVDTN